jgi:hypothetical protein
MNPGDTIDHGFYFRNLKKDHIRQRFERDNEINPKYGYILNKRHWRDAARRGGQISVNLKTCMHSESCSIALHKGGDDYYHVVVINLEALNQIEDFRDSPIIAQYDPIDGDASESKNLCHFELAPENSTVIDWMKISIILEDSFPPAKKLPISEDDKKTAERDFTKYSAYFDIQRWVRSQDGKLG